MKTKDEEEAARIYVRHLKDAKFWNHKHHTGKSKPIKEQNDEQQRTKADGNA